MQQRQKERKCLRCYFSRLITETLHCVKNPPALDLDTGQARWPAVKDDDICGQFRDGSQNHIHTDSFGEYCKIPLTKGQFAKVDPEDYIWLSQFRWFCQKTPTACYAARNGPRTNNKRQSTIFMHRLLAGTPPHLICDHINRNGLDNRKNNLRNCTKAQNNRNQGPHRNSASRFKGVHWNKDHNKWTAKIYAHGKAIHLGHFDNEIEAAKAYDAAAKKDHGQFAALNFPPPSIIASPPKADVAISNPSFRHSECESLP